MNTHAFLSAKGGSGCSTVAALVALHLVRDRDQRVAVLDLAGGDVQRILGSEPDDVISLNTTPFESIGAMSYERPLRGFNGRSGPTVLEMAPMETPMMDPDKSRIAAYRVLEDPQWDSVIVDLGALWRHQHPLSSQLDGPAETALQMADRRTLVTQNCRLAVSRAKALRGRYQRMGLSELALIERPDAVLERNEPAFILELEHVATIPWTPAVHRMVDAGLMAQIIPQEIDSAIADLIDF